MISGASRWLVLGMLLVVQVAMTVRAQSSSASPSAPPAAIPSYLQEFRPITVGPTAESGVQNVTIRRFYDPGPRVLCYLYEPPTVKWARECQVAGRCYDWPQSPLGSISCVRLSDADIVAPGVPSTVEPLPASQRRPAK